MKTEIPGKIFMKGIGNCSNTDAGLLALRLGLAAVFLAHGIQKAMGFEMTVEMFAGLGLPEAVAAVVTAVEILAGLARLLGVYVKYAGYAIAILMVGAIALIKADMGFFGGWEYDLVLLLNGLAVAWLGAGSCRLDVKEVG